MTQELKTILDKELSDALESNDEGRINRCTARYIQAIGDCQQKTSDRVKATVKSVDSINKDISAIKTTLIPMEKSQKRFEELLFEKKIVKKWFHWLKWVLTVVVSIAGYEGVTTLLKIITAM